PIYELFVPFVRMTHSVVIPILAQAVSIPFAAVPLYFLAIKKITPGLALGVSSVALIYPPLMYLAYGDPYETCFAPAITIALLLTVAERRWFVASMLVALALSIKEDQAFFLAWNALLLSVSACKKRDLSLKIFALLTLSASLILGLGYVLYLR